MAPLGLPEARANEIMRGLCASPLDVRSYRQDSNINGIASMTLVTCDLRPAWGPEHDGGLSRELMATYLFDRDGQMQRFDIRGNVETPRVRSFTYHVLGEYTGDADAGPRILPTLPGRFEPLYLRRDGLMIVVMHSPAGGLGNTENDSMIELAFFRDG